MALTVLPAARAEKSPPAKKWQAAFCMIVSSISHDRADQAADETTDQAGAHIAQVVAVTRRIVVVMVMRVVPRGRRRGCVMRVHHAPKVRHESPVSRMSIL